MTVWAMDHALAPCAITGSSRATFIARDLGSLAQLLWLPVRSMDSAEVIAWLERLIAKYGPPLVLKEDNGPAFTLWEAMAYFRRHGIEPLHSPLRRQSCSGYWEASVGAMKASNEEVAFMAGRATGAPTIWRWLWSDSAWRTRSSPATRGYAPGPSGRPSAAVWPSCVRIANSSTNTTRPTRSTPCRRDRCNDKLRAMHSASMAFLQPGVGVRLYPVWSDLYSVFPQAAQPVETSIDAAGLQSVPGSELSW